MRMKPLDDRVLVKVLEAQETTEGGIIIPDTAKEKPIMGEVIEVGTDEDLKELIKIGDKIVFAKYGGDEITIGKDEFKVIQRSDILGIIED
jgi:chaperonin GroES